MSSSLEIYGGLLIIMSNFPLIFFNISLCLNSIFVLFLSAFSLASSKASLDMSVAKTWLFKRLAKVMAIAPLPVPISSISYGSFKSFA